jgi:peptide/nickel transport system permease protein
MSVLRLLGRRVAWAALVVFFVTTTTFVINRALPTDAARMVAGPQARPADVARIRSQLGLDRSVAEQYALFLKRIVHIGPRVFDPKTTPDHANCASVAGLHLDLGRSYQQRRPVVKILAERVPYTFVLAIASVLISVIIGVGTGVFAAVRRNTWWDSATVAAALVGISAPTFLLGVVLQWLLAYRMQLLPLNGAGEGYVSGFVHLLLPALTLGIFYGAYYTRLVRSEMIELLDADYVRTARAKGVSFGRVVVVHALRNALVPIVTVIGLDLGALLGGAIITEQLFSWPGLGLLAVRAMHDRDGPVIVGTVLVAATAVVLANLVVDLLYAALDPRIRSR